MFGPQTHRFPQERLVTSCGQKTTPWLRGHRHRLLVLFEQKQRCVSTTYATPAGANKMWQQDFRRLTTTSCTAQGTLQISMGGEAPDEMHILFMATNEAQGSPPCVYDNEAQQRRAIRLLRSSPVQAWSRVAMDAWKLHENTLPTEDDEMEGDDEESAPAMERAVINQFLRGMVACSPKGTPLALFKFCGSALKEVAVRRLPEMLVEEEAKYGCYSLILESTFVP